MWPSFNVDATMANDTSFPVDFEGQPGYDNSDNLTGSATVGEDDSWGFSPEREVGEVKWPIGILLTTLTVLIAFGNSFVVLAVLLERQLRTFENFFFASLAIADLSIALFVLPLSLSVELSDGRWHFGRAACDFFIFVDVSCCTASILHLCTIGLNRFWSISSPLVYATKQTNRRAFVTILFVWLLSFVIASPPLFGWPKRTNNISGQCTYDENRLYVVCSALGSFYIPLVVMIIVYYKIYCLSKKGAEFRRSLPSKREAKEILPSPHQVSSSHDQNCSYQMSDRSRGSSRHLAGGSSGSDLTTQGYAAGHAQNSCRKCHKLWSVVCRAVTKRREQKSRKRLAEVKTAKTLGLIMTVFVICWLPFFLLYVIKPFCPLCRIPVALDRSALWLGYANSLLNPIIYICCKPLFRRTFKKILLLDYCRFASRYTLHIECCPTRHRLHTRRLCHITEGPTSFSCRAEHGLGRLFDDRSPEMLQQDLDRFCFVRSERAPEIVGLPSWTSARDRTGYSGSSSSPPSLDWSSFDGIKRVPNACVTDIPRSSGGKTEPSQPPGVCSEFVRTQAADSHRRDVYSHTTSVERSLEGESRAFHRPRPQTDLILNSKHSPRVRVLHRRSSWSEPASWRPRECISSSSLDEENSRFPLSNCTHQCPQTVPLLNATLSAVGGTQNTSLPQEGTAVICSGDFGVTDPTSLVSNPDYKGNTIDLQNETPL